MKKLIVFLYAVYMVVNLPTLLAANVVQECYYAEPIEKKVDGNFFQKLIVEGYDENETFASIEKNLRDNIPFSHRFQFKYPLKNSFHAQNFAKVLQIKAQEAHRFVPVIDKSQFIAPCHLGFIREIKIKNEGLRVQEHVLLDHVTAQAIFIEEWVIDSNNIQYPGSFAAINSVIEEEGMWYFAGTYFYNEKPQDADIPNTISMFQETYENMISFIENEDVDYYYNQLYSY
ncbi:MAG: DUF1857 family protein [Nitrosopumilus sp.]|nr:DUF1857 family protein [Nitrosopumilus sp.]